MSCPAASTFPDVGVTMPQMMLISVVLPAPFGPSRAKISPFRISRSTGFKASTPPAYCLRKPRMERIASLIRMLVNRPRFDGLRIFAHEPVAHQHRNVRRGKQEREGKGSP